MKVAFYTLGCKMNFNETEVMKELFKERGAEVVPFSERADVYVINTCTVTHTADAKSRKAVRKAKHRNPNALVVVAGCYPEGYKEEVEKIEEADFIVGNVEKYSIAELVEKRLKGKLPRVFIQGVWKEKRFFPLAISDFEGKTRAFVKVQQGCECFCSYCIIPKVRGPMVSESAEKVITQIKSLVDKGFKEIVLTGTHLGAYRWENYNLAKLIKEISKIEGLYKVRLSSVEPMEFTDELIEIIGETDKVARHFHLPLQSGSNKILQLMNRNYKREEYVERIEKILSHFKTAAVGTDVIVGFPTETEEEFKETLELVKSLPFAYLHVFPYSRRRGTKAALLKDTVPPKEKKERVETLRKLGEEKSHSYRKQFLGKTLEGVTLSSSKVLTDNYITVNLKEEVPPSKVVKVKLTKVGKKREENEGELLETLL